MSRYREKLATDEWTDGHTRNHECIGHWLSGAKKIAKKQRTLNDNKTETPTTKTKRNKKKTKRIIRGDKNVIAEGNEFIPKLIQSGA